MSEDLLLRFMEKLPMFDPTWPKEISDRWFSIFDRLAVEAHRIYGPKYPPIGPHYG